MAQSAQVDRIAQVVAQWEHLTIIVRWEANPEQWTSEQWTSDWPSGHPHPTLDGILDQVGAEGWELVSVAPLLAISFDSPLQMGLNHRYWSPTQYHAIFKRRKRG